MIWELDAVANGRDDDYFVFTPLDLHGGLLVVPWRAERKHLLDWLRSFFRSPIIMPRQNPATAEFECGTPCGCSPNQNFQAWERLAFFVVVNHLALYL